MPRPAGSKPQCLEERGLPGRRWGNALQGGLQGLTWLQDLDFSPVW